jgi:proteinaceous RNase P
MVGSYRPRLRSYSPILLGYSKLGDYDSAFRVWGLAREKGIELTEAEYTALLSVCVSAGRANGLEEVVEAMKEDVMEFSPETCDLLAGWFTGYGLGALPARVSREAAIAEDGTCAHCGQVLEAVDLPEAERATLLAKVDEIVLQDPERGEKWATLKGWIEKYGKDVDVVIDGANVGYYMMNYSGATAHVNYDQIDWLADHFLAEGKRTVIVLHGRHLMDSMMPPKFRPMIDKWLSKKMLYTVPKRNNDDWFWLYLTAVQGPRTVLVTNDEMRDHHFQMLSQKVFLR